MDKHLQKASKHLAKGDQAFQKGKFKAALKSYREAQAIIPEDALVYEKLIQAHEQLKDEWNDTDFAESLAWTMKKQEIENPRLKIVHARLTPEWPEVSKSVKALLQAEGEAAETTAIEAVLNHGEFGMYALIDALLAFKGIRRVPPAKT